MRPKALCSHGEWWACMVDHRGLGHWECVGGCKDAKGARSFGWRLVSAGRDEVMTRLSMGKEAPRGASSSVSLEVSCSQFGR